MLATLLSAQDADCAAGQRPARPRLTTGSYTGPSTRELIERVKHEVDVRRLVENRLEDARDFGRYIRGRCFSPEHPDSEPSALYFADGATCTACGWKADAIDIYRLFHPDVTMREACEALLAGDYLRSGSEGAARPQARRQAKKLDEDQAIRFHFALASNADALVRLEKMGFTRKAIQHFRLGWARVLVRLDQVKDAGKFDPADPELVWKDGEPFQWQWRFSVPVYNDGRLVQILYRKSDDSLGGSKIQMETGAGAQLFNADVLATADLAVFAEGWGDVIALWQWGIPAVTSTNGAGHFRDEWADRLANIRRLYVVGDADNAGQKMVRRFIERLPWARAIRLPHEHGTKRDVRDLLLAGWTRKDFLMLLRQADFEAAWRVVTKEA